VLDVKFVFQLGFKVAQKSVKTVGFGIYVQDLSHGFPQTNLRFIVGVSTDTKVFIIYWKYDLLV
jgi:hypothetical protein